MTRKSTITHVARDAGVSIATVSHVLNHTHYVSEKLTSRVKKAVQELNYRPNYIGRSLRNGRSGTVALIVPDIVDPFFPEIARGVEDFFGKRRYNVFLCNTDEDTSKEQLYLETIESRQVDGVIIAPAANPQGTISTLKSMNKPAVIIDRRVEDMSFDQVLSDNYGGVYEATRHLLDLGHRKIGVVIPIFSVITILDRLEGYRVALKKYGIEMGEHLISQGPLRVEGGYQAAKVLFEDNPDVSAILSTHEAMTLGVMLYLKEKEIACPMDISVVSFDDPPWARAFTPTLTVVVQQAYRMGNEAAHLLWSKLFPGTERKQIRKIKLDTYLQVRESTGIRFEGVRSHERRN